MVLTPILGAMAFQQKSNGEKIHGIASAHMPVAIITAGRLRRRHRRIDGVSHEARGKGMCQKGECSFLIAVPVRSFDSGDSNRDPHMLQVTRGAQYPMVVERTQFPESEIGKSRLRLDVEVQFAGQTAQYKQVPFQVTANGNEAHITGTIPATLTDFKIDPPTLLTIPIKNQIPVDITTTWKKE